MGALADVASRVPLIFPVHPRTRERLDQFEVHPNIALIDPLGYLDFLALQDAASLVMTDSGGVQEETTVLGTPCLTLRESTERPITVTEGTNRVVGTKPRDIVTAAIDVLNGATVKRRPEPVSYTHLTLPTIYSV